MERWQTFEHNAADYLNKKLRAYGFSCVISGGSNAYDSDIKIKKSDKVIAAIECKLTPSQSGQFVIIDNGKAFEFSSKNRSLPNEFTELILKRINADYGKFRKVSQGAMTINLGDASSKWIVDYYKNHKNVDYVCFSDSLNLFYFTEIENFAAVFDITANLRRKRSGSRNLPKKYKEEVLKILQQYTPNVTLTENEGGNIVLSGKFNKDFRGKKVTAGPSSLLEEHHEIYVTQNNQVKILSNTNNPNVIFSIKMNKDWSKLKIDIESFIEAIKSRS